MTVLQPRLSALVLALALALAPLASAEPLVLGYASRPGLAEMADGKPAGTYFRIAAAAAQKSGLETVLRALPQKRLIAEVMVNTPNYCALGIYRTPERLVMAKFSHPFFRDPPLILVVSKGKEALARRYTNFSELSRDTGLRLGKVAGYTYGVVIDGIIARMPGNVEQFVGTYDQNFSKILAGRIDYVMTFPAEFEAFERLPQARRGQLVRIDLPDLPDGVTRSFMCSRAVSDEVMDKLNAGIDALNLNIAPDKVTP